MGWEVHISAAPRPEFFWRVRLLAASLRRNGGLDPVRVVGLVQRECEPYDLAEALPWSVAEGVEWRWIDPELLEAHGPHIVSLERFLGPFEASHVLLLDADTLCVGPLGELDHYAGDAFSALVAFQSPLLSSQQFAAPEPPPERFWHELYASAGLGEPQLVCEHPLWGIVDDEPARRRCPPYFNNGVMAGPADLIAEIGSVVLDELSHVDRYVTSYFRTQFATMLAIARTGVRWRELPLRFNFVNSPELWARFPAEAAAARIVHFLYGEEIDRDADFTDARTIAALEHRAGLAPVNAMLRDRMIELLPEFQTADAAV